MTLGSNSMPQFNRCQQSEVKSIPYNLGRYPGTAKMSFFKDDIYKLPCKEVFTEERYLSCLMTSSSCY